MIIEVLDDRVTRVVHAVEAGRRTRCGLEPETVTVRRLDDSRTVTCRECRTELKLV